MSFLGHLFSGNALQQYPDVEAKIPFEIEGDENDRRRMIALINRIAENSPTGTDVLTEAAQHCKLILSAEQDSVGYASCGDENNPDWRIALNPTYADDVLTSTLVHESRHICQFANGCDKYDTGMLDMKSAVMLDRAMEADADSAACMTVLDLAKAGDTKAFEGFESKRPEVVRAVRDTLTNNPDATREQLQESAFRGWYDSDRMKTVYETNYYTDPMNASMFTGDMDIWQCDREMSSALVVKKACLGGYFKTPQDLESGKYADLSPKTVKTFDKFFALREMRTGMKPDTSYKELGTHEHVKKAKKTKPSSDLSFLQNLAQKRSGR